MNIEHLSLGPVRPKWWWSATKEQRRSYSERHERECELRRLFMVEYRDRIRAENREEKYVKEQERIRVREMLQLDRQRLQRLRDAELVLNKKEKERRREAYQQREQEIKAEIALRKKVREERLLASSSKQRYVSIKLKQIVLTEQNNVCFYCDKPFSETRPPEFDHVMPVWSLRKADNSKENIVAACFECNSVKAGNIYPNKAIAKREVRDLIKAKRLKMMLENGVSYLIGYTENKNQ